MSQHIDEAEMIEILEDLARNSGSATARIQAIKTLREIRGDSKGEEPKGEMARLYAVKR